MLDCFVIVVNVVCVDSLVEITFFVSGCIVGAFRYGRLFVVFAPLGVVVDICFVISIDVELVVLVFVVVAVGVMVVVAHGGGLLW